MFYQENRTVQERAHVKRISHVVSLGGAVAQARGTGRRRQAKQLGAAHAWRSARRAWRCLDECALLLPHKFLQGSACRGAGGAGGAAQAGLSLPSPDWPGLP